jgi:hypothetical protein
MSDQQAFESGLNAGFGRCYLFTHDGYYGIMDSSSGTQPRETFQQEYLAGKKLKELVCAGMCIFFSIGLNKNFLWTELFNLDII